MYKSGRQPSEAFGDFVHRVGFDALRKYSEVRHFPPPPVVRMRLSSARRDGRLSHVVGQSPGTLSCPSAALNNGCPRAQQT